MTRTRTLAVVVLATGPVLAPLSPRPGDDPPRPRLHVSRPGKGRRPGPAARRRRRQAAARPAPEPAALQKAIDRGVEFLLKDQNKDGSWGRPEPKGG